MRFALLTMLFVCLLVVPCLGQTPVNVTFGWDASDSAATAPAGNPVKYRLYTSAISPNGAIPAGAVRHDAGTALEFMVPMTAGSYYVFATAYWCAIVVDGACSGTETVESGLSNVLQLQIQVPPGNPKNYRVRITGIP